jgi:uncharacterized protein
MLTDHHSHKPLVILGKEIRPGQSIQLSMDVTRLPSRTYIDIPVIISRAKEEGPTVLLTAGLHGDEVNGVEILRRLITHKYHIPQKGTIICMPLINVFGFINYSREFPDGRDLNREFPGSPQGALASKIAYLMMEEIVPHIDFGIDFHTGGSSRSNYPQIRYDARDTNAPLLAKVFDAPFTLLSAYLPKSYRWAAAKLNKTILLYEGGESMRLDDFVVKEGYEGVMKILNHFGMTKVLLNDKPQSIILKKSAWLRTKQSGLFRPLVNNGVFVDKNQIVGVITSPYGDFEKKIKALSSGYVICVNNFPMATQGDALFNIGQE